LIILGCGTGAHASPALGGVPRSFFDLLFLFCFLDLRGSEEVFHPVAPIFRLEGTHIACIKKQCSSKR
jgi:hypothetical protein